MHIFHDARRQQRRSAHNPLCRSVFLFALFVSVAALGVYAQQSSTPDITYGGRHEFGIVSGYSPAGGPIWGFQRNVRYSPTVLRYSYPIANPFNGRWQLRYSPEVTAISIMRELAPSSTNPAAPITHYGAGLSPVGFQLVFRPRRRVQPFFGTDAGMLYYTDRVLSPVGSQFMYTIDFGPGVNFFLSHKTTMTVGFRYQHLSNANISDHNPGTDADTITIGFSHFHTKSPH